MSKTIKLFTFITLFASLLVACGGKEANNQAEAKKDSVEEKTEQTESKAQEPAKPEVSEDALRTFLHSKENTFGWQTKSDNLGLDFFKDGRLSVEGPGGEAEMWQGTWTLAGDQLTMECKDCGKFPAKQTLTVKIEGEKLILGEKTYTRYAPDLSK
jgi:hypothetical protein